VIVEGEVRRPGVYKLETNETLRSRFATRRRIDSETLYVLRLAMTRASARVDQQKKPRRKLANSMEVQIRQSAVAVAALPIPGTCRKCSQPGGNYHAAHECPARVGRGRLL